jgi:hypothetical protein
VRPFRNDMCRRHSGDEFQIERERPNLEVIPFN